MLRPVTPRGRRRFMLGLAAWLVLSPIAWALWQWQSERSARSPSGTATSLLRTSTCAEWTAAGDDDRRGFARKEALRRGWEARLAGQQVAVRIDGFCASQPTVALAAFEAEQMTLESTQNVPGG